jgi:hypothetical protein
LLGDTCELSHSDLPVVKLLLRSIILADLVLLVVSSLEGIEDLGAPVVEDLLEVVHHVTRDFHVAVSLCNVLCNILELRVVLLKLDGVVVALQSFSKLDSELVEDSGELLLLVTWAFVPVTLAKVLDERLVDLVDDRVERCNGMLRDLTENDVTVGGSLTDVLHAVWVGSSDKVETFADQLDLIPV